MNRQSSTFTIMAIAILACASLVSGQTRRASRTRSEPIQVFASNERLRVAFEKGDVDGVASFFATEFGFSVFPPGGAPEITTEEALITQITSALEIPSTMEFTEVVFTPLEDGQFRTFNTYIVTEVESGVVARTGTITFTWEFFKGRPLIVRDVTTVDV